ncbi:type IV secretory system conjugative DNA transfer family protein [Sphingomonas sp.]|uniref:type IV secretory system conjugative DNA transfer family protein n=1 Tax=Sphingomonas sp. TaxID=28214 RepID=UPI003415C960
MRHDGPEHVLCFAPTRSGKGVGLVIPTLLTADRSPRGGAMRAEAVRPPASPFLEERPWVSVAASWACPMWASPPFSTR